MGEVKKRLLMSFLCACCALYDEIYDISSLSNADIVRIVHTLNQVLESAQE